MAEINSQLSRNLKSKCQKLHLGPNFSAFKLAAPCIRITLTYVWGLLQALLIIFARNIFDRADVRLQHVLVIQKTKFNNY